MCQGADVQIIIYQSGCFSAAGMTNSAFTPRANTSLCYSVKDHLSLVIDRCGANVEAEVNGCVAKRGADKFDHSQLFCNYKIKETQ